MKRLLTPLHSLAALALDLTHAAFSALADQCRAVNAYPRQESAS